MKLFRITKEEYVEVLTGEGAKLWGGRWNSPGNALIYCSISASLALLETVAWTPIALLLKTGFVMLEITVPGRSLKEINTSKLPKDWNSLSQYDHTRKIGDEWLDRGSSLLLRVPSAILPQEYNVLINPKHRLFDLVVVENVYDIQLDERVLGHLKAGQDG